MYSGIFDGKIINDTELISTTVDVFISANTLIISDGSSKGFRKRKLSISPFHKLMIMTQSSEKITEGFYYHLKGTRVGTYSDGPLGHPGDGEFDTRPISDVRIDVAYRINDIKVDILGCTDEGKGGFGGVLPSREFSITFIIPSSRFKEFFKLNDMVYTNFIGIFNKYAGKA